MPQILHRYFHMINQFPALLQQGFPLTEIIQKQAQLVAIISYFPTSNMSMYLARLVNSFRFSSFIALSALAFNSGYRDRSGIGTLRWGEGHCFRSRCHCFKSQSFIRFVGMKGRRCSCTTPLTSTTSEVYHRASAIVSHVLIISVSNCALSLYGWLSVTRLPNSIIR